MSGLYGLIVRAVWRQQERQQQQEAVFPANTLPKSTTHHTCYLQLVNRASSTYSKANTAQACVLYYVADVYPETIWPQFKNSLWLWNGREDKASVVKTIALLLPSSPSREKV